MNFQANNVTCCIIEINNIKLNELYKNKREKKK